MRPQREAAATEEAGVGKVETDLIEIALQIGGDAEVGNGTFETGETILMTGHEGAARTLLTRGPVVEVMEISANPQASLRMRRRAR